MSKNVTVFNKSERSFILKGGAVIKASGHSEIDEKIAVKLAGKYPADLTIIKAATTPAKTKAKEVTTEEVE